MYKLEKEQFGEFEKYSFFNASTGNGFTVVPEVGGTILGILLNNEQILDACESPMELADNKAYKNSLLFPFPNRMKDGRYELNNRDYHFPINDKATNTALHGLGRDVRMDVLSSAVAEGEATISLSYFHEGLEKAYPFAFLFDVVYTLSDEKGFEVNMKFTNEANEKIPVGIGWHPYFKIAKAIDNLKLKIPDCRMIEIDEQMLPTGNLLDYDYFNESRLIGKAVLDNGFKLNGEGGKKEVILSRPNFQLKYWQETGNQRFNFLQIYTPPSRESIAIEPMTCNIDAFNNGDGLIMLNPEKSITARCGIAL